MQRFQRVALGFPEQLAAMPKQWGRHKRFNSSVNARQAWRVSGSTLSTRRPICSRFRWTSTDETDVPRSCDFPADASPHRFALSLLLPFPLLLSPHLAFLSQLRCFLLVHDFDGLQEPTPPVPAPRAIIDENSGRRLRFYSTRPFARRCRCNSCPNRDTSLRFILRALALYSFNYHRNFIHLSVITFQLSPSITS